MSVAYIGIGTNLGNRMANIHQAINLLESHQVHILQSSTIIETDPVGGPNQGKFLNAVLKVSTEESPVDLFHIAKLIEKKMGRVKRVKNGPRIIDIDILLYDQVSIQTRKLTIPHPRMFERDFVMIPLKEIAPDITVNLSSHAHH